MSVKIRNVVFFMCLAVVAPVSGFARDVIHHDIKVSVDIGKNRLAVEDTIRIPESFDSRGEPILFNLHRGLGPESKNAGVKISPSAEDGNNLKDGTETFRLTFPPVEGRGPHGTLRPEVKSLNITYQGKIFHPVHSSTEAENREDHGVLGTISEEGIFMAGGTFWYPVFGPEMVTFRLEVELPAGWDAVSQGRRTRHDRTSSRTLAVWESLDPQEEIFLIGGVFTEYSQEIDGIDSMVFLRSSDPSLAVRYLNATGPYIDMYQNLIGPYPYGKFALVENFWETGYGMPSFTLLGSRVIRFPFILHSSYPHEILHNWWGNGVYVDGTSGNWSEGLTTYLADHLFQEQEGKGDEFRRDALQRYTDYVAEAKDFALTGFTSRDSPATQAVGYGKTMMLFHMLRQRLGDETFISALRSFYDGYRFHRASFEDIGKVFSKAVGENLTEEFTQWVQRAGAPQLNVGRLMVEEQRKGFLLKGMIEQVQSGPVFQLRLPVAVHLENRDRAYQTHIPMNQKKIDIELSLPARPYRFELDPEFDLFRRLDSEEIPPSLSGSFGAEKILFLLPSNGPERLRAGFKKLAEGLAGRATGKTTIRRDSEIKELPEDHAVWILGWDNLFREEFFSLAEKDSIIVSAEKIKVFDEVFQKEKHSFVFTLRHPEYSSLTMTWVASDGMNALTGLGRKLPHYGKYSYLVFEGDEPTNIAGGQWPVRNSPLSVLIPRGDGSLVTGRKAALEPRKPLAQRPPVHPGK